MALLTVLHYPDSRLRLKAQPIERVDDGIRTLAADMLETMYAEAGIGLAATQVNVQQRIVVIDLSEDRSQPLYLINPVIVMREGNAESREGCLSVPGLFDSVRRAERVRVEALGLEGERVEMDCEGLFAFCIQHEIDHLDGRLFIDRLSPLKRRRMQKKLTKQQKQQAQLVL